MIEKPPHLEPPKPVADEKPNGRGSHYIIREEPPRVGRPRGVGWPIRPVFIGVISFIAILVETNSVVAIYGTHAQAEEAVKELQKSGFDMKKMSIVGKDYHTDEHVVGYYNTGDRMRYWGKMGAFWGGIWGMLFGAAFFVIPGLGPILVAGPLVAWIIGALEGAVVVGGLSALGAGLYSIGIPKDSVVKYETALKSDKFLLLAHGTADEVATARDILQTTHPVEVAVHGTQREQFAGSSGR
jgi:hypothetical protein